VKGTPSQRLLEAPWHAREMPVERLPDQVRGVPEIEVTETRVDEQDLSGGGREQHVGHPGADRARNVARLREQADLLGDGQVARVNDLEAASGEDRFHARAVGDGTGLSRLARHEQTPRAACPVGIQQQLAKLAQRRGLATAVQRHRRQESRLLKPEEFIGSGDAEIGIDGQPRGQVLQEWQKDAAFLRYMEPDGTEMRSGQVDQLGRYVS
jgi:hypothetical protein